MLTDEEIRATLSEAALRFHTARWQQRKTLRTVAQESGSDSATLSRFERNGRASVETWLRVQDWLAREEVPDAQS